MTAARRASAFCTCADLPAHYVGPVSSAALSKTPAASSAEASVEEPSDIDARRTEREHEGRFCTCSDAPTRVVARRETGSEEAAVAVGEARTDATRGASIVREHAPTSKSSSDVTSEEPVMSSVSELLPGETALYTSSTHGRGGSEVILTEKRVLLRGAPDADMLHASMRFSEIDSVTISRSQPKRRSLVWGLVGIAASIGMWQALDGVGNLRLIIAVIVVVMSAVLLADYFLRPPDLLVGLRATSGAEMKIGFGQSHADEADRFAARVLSMMEMRSRD